MWNSIISVPDHEQHFGSIWLIFTHYLIVKWHLKFPVPFLARLYESTGRGTAVTTRALGSASASALIKIIKFLVKVIRSLYLLNLLILCLVFDSGLKFMLYHHDPHQWSWSQGHGLWNIKLKFLVTDFRSLYLLKFWLDLVDTLPDIRYWSEVLCYTITTHISDLEVRSRTLKF